MKALLRATVESGIAGRARAVGWPVYGKTGTTNNYSDAWLVGFDDFAKVLNDAKERQEMGSIIKELQPEYGVGQVVNLKTRAR